MVVMHHKCWLEIQIDSRIYHWQNDGPPDSGSMFRMVPAFHKLSGWGLVSGKSLHEACAKVLQHVYYNIELSNGYPSAT